MHRKFYLSIVYDTNGYNRLDLTSRESLQKLDELISEYNNRDDVINAYLSEYNIDKKKGRVCIVYEDLNVKKKELLNYRDLNSEDKEKYKDSFTYAHIIPIMYNKRQLLGTKSCINILKSSLYKREIVDSIMYDKETKNGELIKSNKRYLFETEEERDYLYNLKDYHTAVALFLQRIEYENLDTQYLYFRSLIDVCKLGISVVKTKNGNVNIREGNTKKINKYELTRSEELEIESEDMDKFYLYNDLDDVIKYSPNMNRPIGSERKRK